MKTDKLPDIVYESLGALVSHNHEETVRLKREAIEGYGGHDKVRALDQATCAKLSRELDALDTAYFAKHDALMRYVRSCLDWADGDLLWMPTGKETVDGMYGSDPYGVHGPNTPFTPIALMLGIQLEEIGYPTV